MPSLETYFLRSKGQWVKKFLVSFLLLNLALACVRKPGPTHASSHATTPTNSSTISAISTPDSDSVLAAKLSPQLSAFFQKQVVTIAVVDSGLGGLSIMGDTAFKVSQTKHFKKVNMVFFNALFDAHSGYNMLESRTARIAVFNAALQALSLKVKPDLILIGCNTLSVIYPDTAFARTASVPVLDIVDPGIALLAKSLHQRPDATVLLFATETTLEEDKHRAALVASGIHPARITTQACQQLIPHIEHGFNADHTRNAINACVEVGFGKVAFKASPLFISLNCTHFPYSSKLWKEAFTHVLHKPLAGILNPNPLLADRLMASLPPQSNTGVHETKLNARIMSMVPIAPDTRVSLGSLIQKDCPACTQALKNVSVDPALFEWRSLLQNKALEK